MLSVSGLHVSQRPVSESRQFEKPLVFPHTASPSLTFEGKAAPSVLKEAIELRKKQEQFMSKVVYERDGECITGYDLLKAVQKTGARSAFKPWVNLNPVKWVQWTMAAMAGDGFSNYVGFNALFKELPLKFSDRGKKEQEHLLNSLFQGLMALEQLELLHYGSANDHIKDVWRPTARGKSLVKQMGLNNARNKASRTPHMDGDIKSRFEQQIKELQQQQKRRSYELQTAVSQVEAQESQIQELNKTLADKSRQFDHLTQKRLRQALLARELEAQQNLADQIGLLKEDLKHQKELLEAMKLQASYTETVTRELNYQTNQFIGRIKQTLSRIEISKVNAQMLKMSGRLQEKDELEKELGEQIEEANRAYITLKTAMETNNPEVYLKAMELLRQSNEAVSMTVVKPLAPPVVTQANGPSEAAPTDTRADDPNQVLQAQQDEALRDLQDGTATNPQGQRTTKSQSKKS